MSVPAHINTEAIELLERNGWTWSEYYFSFRRVIARAGDRLDAPPDLITFEELEDNGLGTPPEKNPRTFAKGLEWLKARIGANGSLSHQV